MSVKTDAELTAAANVIANETVAGANTKVRVSDILKDIIDSKPNNPLRAGYNVAVTNQFPATGGTGALGAILTGNMFPVTTQGTIDLGSGPEQINVGTILFALTDNPGQDPTKWRVI